MARTDYELSRKSTERCDMTISEKKRSATDILVEFGFESLGHGVFLNGPIFWSGDLRICNNDQNATRCALLDVDVNSGHIGMDEDVDYPGLVAHLETGDELEAILGSFARFMHCESVPAQINSRSPK